MIFAIMYKNRVKINKLNQKNIKFKIYLCSTTVKTFAQVILRVLLIKFLLIQILFHISVQGFFIL